MSVRDPAEARPDHRRGKRCRDLGSYNSRNREGTESLFPKQFDKIVRATSASSCKDKEVEELLLSSASALLTSSQQSSLVQDFAPRVLRPASQGRDTGDQAGIPAPGRPLLQPDASPLSPFTVSSCDQQSHCGPACRRMATCSQRAPGGGHRGQEDRKWKTEALRETNQAEKRLPGGPRGGSSRPCGFQLGLPVSGAAIWGEG